MQSANMESDSSDQHMKDLSLEMEESVKLHMKLSGVVKAKFKVIPEFIRG